MLYHSSIKNLIGDLIVEKTVENLNKDMFIFQKLKLTLCFKMHLLYSASDHTTESHVRVEAEVQVNLIFKDFQILHLWS